MVLKLRKRDVTDLVLWSDVVVRALGQEGVDVPPFARALPRDELERQAEAFSFLLLRIDVAAAEVADIYLGHLIL